MIVVDTNVASELMRPSPSPSVVAWVRASSPPQLHTTAITVAEVLYGIERLAEGRRRTLLGTTAREVFSSFADRVLPFDERAAEEYAEIVAAREAGGRPISGFDAQIAAICRGHGATLATRNATDFQETGIVTLNPWIARS
ncbi:MAG: type II toxin-antitoxin system VapC family toxin [Thermoleophilaceae bacterium]